MKRSKINTKSPPLQIESSPLHIACIDQDLKSVLRYIETEDINALDSDGSTPLHYACIKGNKKIAKILLAAGANPKITNKAGYPPFELAKIHGKEEVFCLVQKVMSKKINPQKLKSNLVEAIYNNDFELSKELLDNESIKQQDDAGRTLLHHVALRKISLGNQEKNLSESSKLKITKLLIEKGADPNVKDNQGITPIDLAFERDDIEIFQYMTNHNPQIGALDKEALIRLIKNKNKLVNHKFDGNIFLTDPTTGEVLRFAKSTLKKVAKNIDKSNLKAEAKANYKELHQTLANINHAYDLPLSQAAKYGFLAIVRFCVKTGFDIEQKLNYKTPLHLAVSKKHFHIADFLLSNGASLETTDTHRATPIFAAIYNNDQAMCRLLIAHNAKINIQTADHFSLIDIACRDGLTEILKILLEHKVQPLIYHLFDTVSNGDLGATVELLKTGKLNPFTVIDGETLLHKAIRSKSIPMVKKIIDIGIEVNKGNSSKTTPLHLAASMSNAEAAKLLIEHGADLEALDVDGSTPLNKALMSNAKGRQATCDVLINAIKNKNAANKPDSLDIFAAIKKQGVSSLEKLIQAGAQISIEDKDSDNNNLYHIMAGSHKLGLPTLNYIKTKIATTNEEIIKQKINAQNKLGETPLLLACIEGNLLMVEYLLTLGANSYIPDTKGNYLIHYLLTKAVNLPSWHSKKKLVNYNKILALVLKDHPDQLNLTNKEHQTPLVYSITQYYCYEHYQYQYMTSIIKKYDPDLSIKDKNNNTLLHLIVSKSWILEPDITMELAPFVSAKACFAIQNSEEKTPLIIAAASRHTGPLEALLALGDIIDDNVKAIKDNKNLTAADYLERKLQNKPDAVIEKLLARLQGRPQENDGQIDSGQINTNQEEDIQMYDHEQDQQDELLGNLAQFKNC